jgi:hypothetical protein
MDTRHYSILAETVNGRLGDQLFCEAIHLKGEIEMSDNGSGEILSGKWTLLDFLRQYVKTGPHGGTDKPG